MKKDKLVSIIIPIYNAEKHISKCLNSVLNQTYVKFELILVNDGSTDKSLDICEEFQKKDNRIRIISIKNSGPSVARNKGLSESKGELLQFVDSDDFVEVNITEKLINALNENSQLVISGYNSIFEDTVEEKYLTDKIYDLKDTLENFTELYENLQFQYLWNKIYIASIIKKNNLKFSEETKRGEDILFNIKYIEHCNFINIISDRLYNYVHYNTDSLTKNYNQNLYVDQKRVFNQIRNLLVHHNKYSFNKARIEKLYIQRIVNCFDNLYSKSNELNSNQRLIIIKEILDDKYTRKSVRFYRGAGFKWVLLKLLMYIKSKRGIKLLYDIKYKELLKNSEVTD